MAMDLLLLEYDCHKNEKDGLKCLRDNLNSHELLPWIFETYKRFYSKTHYKSALRMVIVELVIMSYLPYFLDIYFDITLANSYRKYSSTNFNVSHLWSCGEIQLNSSCYEKIGPDHPARYHTDGDSITADGPFEDISNIFRVAFWITIVLLSITVGFYIIFILFMDSSLAWLISLVDKKKIQFFERLLAKNQRVKEFCHTKFLIWLSKLLWPIGHCYWQLEYLASPKRSQYKHKVATRTLIWSNIKIVEYGLESSIQLLLQLWLLRPFLSITMTWDTTELIIRCFSGFANYNCYVEIALAKIFLTIFFLSLSMSQMRKKPGQGLLYTLPLFVSIFAQTVGRIVALKSLVLMTTSLGYYKYALFFVPHVLIVFVIKTLFEVKSLRDKVRACCSSEGRTQHIWQIITFIISGLSSTIVLIHLRRDKKEGQHARNPSFLSHSAFQILILVEHLILVILPFVAYGNSYPPEDCFPANSKCNAIWIVLVAWLLGSVFQVIHYKWCSPLSGLNGPHADTWLPPSQISFPATLCWKKETQMIEVTGCCCLNCTDDIR
jgi:hypothetical protein